MRPIRTLHFVLASAWEIPLAIMSYCFYFILRTLFRRNVVSWRHSGRGWLKRPHQGEVIDWLGLSELLRQPMMLPYVMVCAPRWNCDAVIGSVGPFTVNSEIEIETDTVRRSARQWSLVIQQQDRQTKAFLSSGTGKEEHWQRIALEPGRYAIVLRYHNCIGSPAFPAVRIDGVQRIEFRAMTRELGEYQSYLETHRDHRGILYYCMHYHVYCLLKWKRWLVTPFVMKRYLPGRLSPNTRYFYGSVKRGDVLTVNIARNLFPAVEAHVTVYNVCSFPVIWDSIDQAEYRTGRLQCDGTYLVRVQGKQEDSIRVDERLVNCMVLADSRETPTVASA